VVITNLDSVYVLIEAIDTLGCLDDKRIKVFTLELPTPEVADAEACIDQFITLDGTPTNIAIFDTVKYDLTYDWTEISSGYIDSTATIDVSVSGDYIVTVTIEQCSNSDTANVIIYNPPTGLLPDIFTYCELESEYADLVASEDSTLSFLWSTGDTTMSIQVDQEGFYSVRLTSALNCVSTASTTVEELCEPEIFVPTGFTPGTGGDNSWLNIFGHHISSLKMTIYNRWGEVIYYTDNKNDAWDGYYRGELMPIGTYPWIIEYEGYEPYIGPYTLSGSVTIVR
jgi:gliding motility-associated-like protein